MSARRYSPTDLALLTKDGLAAQLPSPPVRKKRGDPEGEIQRAFIKAWDNSLMRVANGVHAGLLFSIPNGAALGFGKEEYQKKQRGIRGKLLKLAGLRSGVPDLFLSVPRRGYHGCYIEFKTPKGVVSDEQETMCAALHEQLYQVHVCRSVDEAMKAVENYLGWKGV